MKILKLALVLLPLVLLTVDLSQAQSQSPAKVKQRMKANLPAIEKLKKAEKVGETNQGFLKNRMKLTVKEDKLVKTENADRKFVYQLLARRAKTSIQKIQMVRAEQIRKRSAPGIWLQDPKGTWYKKKREPVGRRS